MCGIVGILDQRERPADGDAVRRMAERIIHRGPDEDGFFTEGEVGLGMRRLSIIDLSGGRQPITNEDGSVVTVFNGEIYNFQTLRADLESRGHVFHTSTDTEVIPHLYEEMGARFVERLVGMFGIAVWSKKNRELVIARDQLGIKPIYYAERDGRLYFGSELKCLTELFTPEIDPEAAFYFMSFGYIPGPRTIYQGVYKLQPGHILRARGGTVTIERYWRPRFDPGQHGSEEETTERFHDLLREAVKLQLVSDVPLGAFLSGGVDSSLVVAMMTQAAGGRVRTCSISFDEAAYNEGEYAKRVAEILGTQHTDYRVKWDIADNFAGIIEQYDEPFADESAIPTYFLCKVARQQVTVALSGDGGDEIAAGYHRYFSYLRKRKLYNLPRLLRRQVLARVGKVLPDHVRGKRFLTSLGLDPKVDYVIGHAEFHTRHMFTREFLPQADSLSALDISSPVLETPVPTELDALCLHDLMIYLPDDILTKVDRMSMRVSLEVRVPLLDHRVVEFAISLPLDLRIRNGVGKYILKRILGRYLPEDLIHRRKHGFGVPVGQWFRGDLKEAFFDVAGPQQIKQAGLLDPQVVAPLVQAHMEGRHNYQALLWRIFVLQYWYARQKRSAHRAAPAGTAA